ncbi:hypothetical protein [Psychrilyobacter piezotolerans]|uniref:Uncharacterized protein n=1 Tax=Psychrilyobacter piezotolerans TaxID=2293438 RepID=A0ABX9KIZ2_9FUSO|nr:hypothetical protein [Psychrilyobacter piezotolerans]MCS5422196.1 hypothetical protein [Psychrilyobacter sp. S5]RDE64149.1 hypothetical protein DV867_04260 [Psychrilyobacter sp. S5]REI42241.1 hypothetical protein DYH56_04260 [Psychrilyobacter piezotolerans]
MTMSNLKKDLKKFKDQAKEKQAEDDNNINIKIIAVENFRDKPRKSLLQDLKHMKEELEKRGEVFSDVLKEIENLGEC